MRGLVLGIMVIVFTCGLPWLAASVIAGGSDAAQLSAALAVVFCIAMGTFVKWVEER